MHETKEEEFSFENDNNSFINAKMQAFPFADDEFFLSSNNNKMMVTKL